MNHRSPHRAPAQKLRERFREATNEAILAAAEKVFAAQGLSAAKMEAIAGEAGVAVGTLYNHFQDRESLLVELVAHRRQQMVDRMDKALATTERQPFQEQLRALLTALCEHLEAHQAFLAIWMECEASRSQNLRQLLGNPNRELRHADEIFRRVETLVRRGLREKALRAEGAEIYPAMLMGMFKGFMVRRLANPELHKPLDLRVDQMTQFFLHGAGA
ncbi:MAG: TetR/AcrR family transcriptional regulator [Deltaproteobacteria bacterium]|nr:TetR/AcrR family transcriptional regulator [Deltaproteobacteria bacterium]